MSDDDKSPAPGFVGGARSGMGWALGFSAVMGIASTLRGGTSPALKGAIKAFIRARHGVAEAGERARDLYAEAHGEYHAEMDGAHHASAPLDGAPSVSDPRSDA